MQIILLLSVLLDFPVQWGNLWGNPYISSENVMQYYRGLKFDGSETFSFGKGMGIGIPGSFQRMNFTALS